ncbi:response regulator [Candidatus Binatia bacterium]|nr:response regulator [Candidatus Binatia bacterium]
MAAADVGRILLVDDEESVLFAITEYLTLQGHEVHRASDVQRAAELLAAQTFGFVVTDLHLTPARAADGFEIARLARDAGVRRVVLLTAHGTPEVRRQAIALGIDEVIAKPVRLSELESVLLDGSAEPAR